MSCTKKRKLEEKFPFYPVLPAELIDPIPLRNVYIDTILDRKNISKVVVNLNSILPLPELTHLKRINDGCVLLLPCNEDNEPDKINELLKSRNFNTSFLENNIRIASVAAIAPKTKKQHDIVHKLWPCNFHSNKYVEKLCTNTLFGQKEIDYHISYMKVALDIAEHSQVNQVGVVVVDPKINSIVAVGFDKRTDNPCQHAVMIAIDNVALTQKGGAWQRNSETVEEGDLNLNGISSSILCFLQEKYGHLKFGATKYKGKGEIETPSDGPYLCTGYYVYSTHEPCVMCAMALIHSRVKMVFYGSKSEKGGLESLCKMHTVKDLNHHYDVFGGLLEEQCSKLL